MAEEQNGLKLSVIVPVYNVEPYITKALDSLIGQTYKNIEIILADDGSTDKSGLICDEYASRDARIKVIHKENGGIVSARKAAIREATGEYVINFDPDDWIEKDAYGCVAERIKEFHPDMVAFGVTKEYSDFSEKYPLDFPAGYHTAEEFWKLFRQSVDEHLFFKQPMDMTQWNKAIRTDLAKKYQMQCSEELKKNVDDAVIFPCLLNMRNIYIDSECWYHYCVRKTSILWRTEEEDFDRFIRLARHMLMSYKESGGKEIGLKKFLLYKMVHHMMLDIPEWFFPDGQCMIYPRLCRDSSIIIYGKGVFANRLMTRMRESGFADIVDNVDSKDVARLQEIQNYDYIVVAVFHSIIVESILRLLEENHIPKEKILIIDKDDISPQILPEEIRELYETVMEEVGE